MQWIWANESTSDDEAFIYGTSDQVERLDLDFENGMKITSEVPLIEITLDEESQGVLTDNLISGGIKGLLFSSRLRNLLEKIGVNNIQYFPALIINPYEGKKIYDYQVANIVGRSACIDKQKSVLEYSPDEPGHIEFIESLVLDGSKIPELDMFRLEEKSLIIVVSVRVKQACEKSGITGVRFYFPEGYIF